MARGGSVSETNLDWTTAEVDDGQLTVSLDGNPPAEWAERFETTAKLLNHGTWEKVKLKKDEVRVRPVVEGEEDKLRHFLESVVLEANAAVEAKAENSENSENADGDESESEQETGEETSADREMTDRFRGFGETEESES
jgi:hypothetical protein